MQITHPCNPLLKILATGLNTTTHRTNKRATAGRSTFYALNTVGSRFGWLHPLTSLKLYQALCLPLLLYGSELWALTKTELLSLERVHRKILRTIQGLPIRCHSASLTTLLDLQDIQTLVQQRQLSFIVSVVNLDPDDLPRKLLYARSPPLKMWDPNQCKCICCSNINCPAGSTQNQITCACSPCCIGISNPEGIPGVDLCSVNSNFGSCHFNGCSWICPH